MDKNSDSAYDHEVRSSYKNLRREEVNAVHPAWKEPADFHRPNGRKFDSTSDFVGRLSEIHQLFAADNVEVQLNRPLTDLDQRSSIC